MPVTVPVPPPPAAIDVLHSVSCQRNSLELSPPTPNPAILFPSTLWVQVRRRSAGQVGEVSAATTSGLIAADPQC